MIFFIVFSRTSEIFLDPGDYIEDEVLVKKTKQIKNTQVPSPRQLGVQRFIQYRDELNNLQAFLAVLTQEKCSTIYAAIAIAATFKSQTSVR